jgi:hypothetical protein
MHADIRYGEYRNPSKQGQSGFETGTDQNVRAHIQFEKAGYILTPVRGQKKLVGFSHPCVTHMAVYTQPYGDQGVC